MKLIFTRWGSGLLFASSLMFVSATWTAIYKLTGSVLAPIALISCQVAAVVYCYLRFRKDIAPAMPAAGAAVPAP